MGSVYRRNYTPAQAFGPPAPVTSAAPFPDQTPHVPEPHKPWNPSVRSLLVESRLSGPCRHRRFDELGNLTIAMQYGAVSPWRVADVREEHRMQILCSTGEHAERNSPAAVCGVQPGDALAPGRLKSGMRSELDFCGIMDGYREYGATRLSGAVSDGWTRPGGSGGSVYEKTLDGLRKQVYSPGARSTVSSAGHDSPDSTIDPNEAREHA